MSDDADPSITQVKPRSAGLRSSPWNLARLLEGIGERRFFSGYYEKRPLLLSGGDPRRYSDLFNPANLDPLFSQVASVPNDDLHVIREGRLLEGLPTGRDELLPFLRASVADGYSLVLYHASRYWPAIAALTRSLAEQVRCEVDSTLFLTPARSRGMDRHFDVTDVFVLQLEGTKQWSISRPTAALPGASQWRELDPQAPVASGKTVTLHAGDLYYLPRGFEHAARAGEAASLHIAVYIKPYSWRHYLHDLVDQAAEMDVALRRSQPFWPAASRDQARPPRLVARMLKDLPAGSNQRALDFARERLVATLTPLASNSPDLPLTCREFCVEDQIERIPGQMGSVRRHSDGLHLGFPGGALSAPDSVEPALRFMIATNGPFPVSALPGRLSDKSKKVLVKRLVEMGFLRLVPARPHETAPR